MKKINQQTAIVLAMLGLSLILAIPKSNVARFMALALIASTCPLAHFSFPKNTLANKLAVYSALPGIIAILNSKNFLGFILAATAAAVPLFFLFKKLPKTTAKEEERQAKEAEQKAALDTSLDIMDTEDAYDEAIADIKTREADAIRPLEQAVQTIAQEISSLQQKLEANEAEWAEQIASALAPFDIDIEAAEDAISRATKALSATKSSLSILEAKRFPKGTSQADIDAHNARVEQADLKKAKAQGNLDTAELALSDLRRSRNREELQQKQLIAADRTPAQRELLEKKSALSAAELALATAKATNATLFDEERRKAERKFKRATAPLKAKAKI